LEMRRQSPGFVPSGGAETACAMETGGLYNAEWRRDDGIVPIHEPA
jgi:hypothetical protein